MKKLIVAFFCAASLLALTTSGTSKHSHKNINTLTVNDTLPHTDTMYRNTKRIDTFGGINKPMADSSMGSKKRFIIKSASTR